MTESRYRLTAQDKTRAAFASFRRSLSQVKSEAAGAGLSLKGLVGVAGIGALARSSLNAANQLKDLETRLGTSVGFLSRMQFASDATGVRWESMTTSLQRMIRRTAEANEGSEGLTTAFANLGINAQKFVNLPVDTQVLVFAEAFSQASKGGDRLMNTIKILDTEGAAVTQTFAGGAQGLAEMFVEAERVGGVLDEGVAKNAEKANKSLALAKASIRGLAATMSAELIPIFEPVVSGFATLTKGVLRLAVSLKDIVTLNVTNLIDLFANLFSGNFSGAKLAAERFMDDFKKGLSNLDIAEAFVPKEPDTRGAVKKIVDQTREALDAVRADSASTRRSAFAKEQKDLDLALKTLKDLISLRDRERDRGEGVVFNRRTSFIGSVGSRDSIVERAEQTARQLEKIQIERRSMQALEKLVSINQESPPLRFA